MPKNAIVIGASSGIGFALTQALLERSFAVGACSRHLEPLQILQEKFSPERCLLRRMDVTETDEASRTLAALIGTLSDVQLIILNAGVGHLNPDSDWKLDQEVIRTNVLGFTALTCVAIKYFEQRGEGRLVGISSISALRGSRHATSYAASKAYISNYLEGLNQRFVHAGLPIVAIDVRPGFVDTPMSRQLPRRFWVARPEKAAEQILDAAEKGRRQVYITRRWASVAWLFKRIPRSLYRRM
jgi:short-subunit dehydrogenase